MNNDTREVSEETKALLAISKLDDKQIIKTCIDQFELFADSYDMESEYISNTFIVCDFIYYKELGNKIPDSWEYKRGAPTADRAENEPPEETKKSYMFELLCDRYSDIDAALERDKDELTTDEYYRLECLRNQESVMFGQYLIDGLDKYRKNKAE